MAQQRKRLLRIAADVESQFAHLHNVEQFRLAAMRLLSQNAGHYLSFGSADGITTAHNQEMFQRIRFIPRLLKDVSKVSTEVELMGEKLAGPVVLSPTSLHTKFHPDGEVASAKAVSACDSLMMVSTYTGTLMEQIPAYCVHPPWFQLSMFGSLETAESLIMRAEKSGFACVVVTVDHKANRLIGETKRPPYETVANLAQYTELRNSTMLDGVSITWLQMQKFVPQRIDWIRSLTDLPIFIKGILHPRDVEICVNHGVSGIVVSNHGGRQLDTCISTIEALPDIVSAAGGELTILLDGGIRKGADVFKALALGADAVGIGRPSLYGLSVGGALGVECVLKLLDLELRSIMRQTGFTSIAEIKQSGRDCLDFTEFTR